MKTKLLTQIELATLAANLPTGTARERVTLAFEIWEAAADLGKIEDAFLLSELSALSAPRKKSLQSLSLQDALATFMPTTSPSARLDRWRRFRQWQRDAGSLGPYFEDDEKIGVALDMKYFDEIKEWELAEKSAVRSKTSHRMHLGKYGEKWIQDALRSYKSQTLEMLESNTLKNLKGKWKGNRDEAKSRVQALIEDARLVKIDGKLYGTPESGKTSFPTAKTKSVKKK